MTTIFSHLSLFLYIKKSDFCKTTKFEAKETVTNKTAHTFQSLFVIFTNN